MLFGGTTIKTNVYVDGFNLYYGAAKNTPFKWVNLAALCTNIIPGLNIHRLRYFTAFVKPLPSDPRKRVRQEIYIRALKTLPNVTVHLGHFLQSTVSMPLASPLSTGPRFADVVKMEEKGSDVNIATYMLVDAFRNDCEQLVVITNDSDLAEPVRIINKELKIPVGIFNPQTSDTAIRRARLSGRPLQKARPSVELKKCARFYREITSEGPACHMALSQFPVQMIDANGHKIQKPATW
ncbi:NYN domain-containing protein [Acidobacteria bacterium AB60]|nr:NYN domain-containing protein [Acidobacteria bacterium AB60]